MNGLQVAAGLVLLCMIAWLCFPMFGRERRVKRRALPADVFRHIAEHLPADWSIYADPVSGATVASIRYGAVFNLYTQFSTLYGGDYPETTIVLARDCRTIATTWALSPVASQIIMQHLLRAINLETTTHDDTH